MKLRPLAVGAVLAAVALFGSACGKDDPAPNDPAASTGAEQGNQAREELKTALEKSGSETALKMTVEMTGLSIEAHVDTAAKTARMTTKTDAAGEAMEMEMLVFDAETYIQYVSGGLAEQMKGKWVKVDSASLGQDEMFGGEFFDVDKILAEDSLVTEIGDGEYKIEMGAGKAPDVGGLFGGLTGGDDEDPAGTPSDAPTSIVVTVGADGFVSGFKAEGAKPEQNATITFSDYGTSPKIEKPAAKDVVEG